jgi:ATP-dependent DNA ligase
MTELMKGHKWRDRKHKMTYPAWVEIKYDEIRCHVIVNPQNFAVDYLSYAGKQLHNLAEFDAKWVELAHATGLYEFDTGFEANGNYNDSYRWVRSSKGLPDDLIGKPTKFLLFDLPTVNARFDERMGIRNYVAVLAMSIGFYNLSQPVGAWADEPSNVDAMFQVARESGFEGLMVKSLDHTYERGKRTDGWLKVKPEDDADGIITALHEAISENGTPLGRIGSITIKVEDGSEASPHGIAHDLGRDMYKNPLKYLGQWAEFVYMERDRAGGYRHPVFHRIREAKA